MSVVHLQGVLWAFKHKSPFFGDTLYRIIVAWHSLLNSSCFRLVCEAKGEPAPDVFWTRESNKKVKVTDKNTGKINQGNYSSTIKTKN